jgi:DNA-binding response OmpR family regulator
MVETSILIVCDEPVTSKIWAFCIAELYCRPLVANSIEQAVSTIEESAPDLIVVDVTSWDVGDILMCRALREHTHAPLLLLTSSNHEAHSLEAYQAGVDDCIIKPISPALFLAKIRVWLHRSWTAHVENLEKLTVGSFTLERAKHLLQDSDGKRIRLSNLEFRVLCLLMDHPNQPFTSEEIIERVWGFHGEGNSALVKNVIYRLRKKIEPNREWAQILLTETGGYLFRRDGNPKGDQA